MSTATIEIGPIVSPAGPAKVGIIMGSQSDWATMNAAAQLLADFDVAFECEVVSAHRTVDHQDALWQQCGQGGAAGVGRRVRVHWWQQRALSEGTRPAGASGRLRLVDRQWHSRRRCRLAAATAPRTAAQLEIDGHHRLQQRQHCARCQTHDGRGHMALV